MFRMDAIDCNEYESLCNKEKVNKYPLFRVYPPFPAPT